MQRIFSVALLFLLVACTATPVSAPLALLPENCTAPGEIISAELAEPARGYSFGYLV